MRSMLLSLLILGIVSPAGANSFTAEGTVFEASHGYTFRGTDRNIPDGSFEGGTCLETPIWTCTTDNSCDWIMDLVPLGLWNYDGMHVAWLGGFCEGLATCTTSICQEVVLWGGCSVFSWYWMAYVNDAIMHVTVTFDGDPVYEFYPQLSDHLLDYDRQVADVSLYEDGSPHMLCFSMDNPGCAENMGDNYFIDFLSYTPMPTAIQFENISTIKSLY